jgi:hypothetical protein
MNDSAASIVDHTHCFCTQDTGGNWICCKCGKALNRPSSWILIPSTIYYPFYVVPPVTDTAGGSPDC